MSAQRYLCSDLVTLRLSAADFVVNLEEIWRNGAVVESEVEVQEGAAVEIRAGAVLFAGRIVHVESHEFGWRLEVTFSPLTPWNLETYQPRHMLLI